MKIFFSKYQIQTRRKINSQVRAGDRDGALLKLELAPHVCGYADLFPFPEFGEAGLEEQLESLRTGTPTVLGRRALAYAHLDARARTRQRSLFSGLVLPLSHKRVRDLDEARAALQDGFTRLKIKMGFDLTAETKWLEELSATVDEKILLRLDFNGALKLEEFATWWKELNPQTKAQIDFIEDAFRPDLVSRAEILRAEASAPLAWDWFKPEIPIRRVVVKPLRETFETVGPRQRVIFTHSMGHRLGQAACLWSAARFYRKYPAQMEIGGLRPTPIDSEWMCHGPKILAPVGTGFGLDRELREKSWELLA